MHHHQISFLDSDHLSGRAQPCTTAKSLSWTLTVFPAESRPGCPLNPGVPPSRRLQSLLGGAGRGSLPLSLRPPPAEGRQRASSEACLSPPRGDSRLPDHDEVPTVSRRGRILRSGAESQRIAVRQLLNRLQHPGRYVSRLQTVRCGHTARGSYLHSGGRSPAFPGSAEFPLHGLVTGRLTVL